jgi:hypothetical protein
MSIVGHFPKHIHEDKHCFFYCGPDRCDCRAGNPLDVFAQIINRQIADAFAVTPRMQGARICLSCGAATDAGGNLPCGH